MPRLFVAVPVGPAASRALAELRTGLRSARWTPDAQIHLTLRFLGDTPEAQVPPLIESLAAVRAPSLTLRLDGLTTFPSRRRPRVLVARVAPDEALAALQRDVEVVVRGLGFPAEPRPFRPHITLARLRNADSEEIWRFTRERRVDMAVETDRFGLYASRLTPEGAIHDRVAGFPLGEA